MAPPHRTRAGRTRPARSLELRRRHSTCCSQTFNVLQLGPMCTGGGSRWKGEAARSRVAGRDASLRGQIAARSVTSSRLTLRQAEGSRRGLQTTVFAPCTTQTDVKSILRLVEPESDSLNPVTFSRCSLLAGVVAQGWASTAQDLALAERDNGISDPELDLIHPELQQHEQERVVLALRQLAGTASTFGANNRPSSSQSARPSRGRASRPSRSVTRTAQRVGRRTPVPLDRPWCAGATRGP